MDKRKLKQILWILIGVVILFEVIRAFYLLEKGMETSKRIIDDSNISIKTAIEKQSAQQKADSLPLADSIGIKQ